MEKKYWGSKFYSSWLNTILLFVLIVLMIIALRFMYKNQETYLPLLQQENEVKQQVKNTEILGNKDDLVAFSISPNTKVHGIAPYHGVVKGGYFSEGNILVNVLDMNKKVLLSGHGTAKDNWMTAGPVNFEGVIDFKGIKKGTAYIEIQNDDPSGGEGGPAKKIQIPIIIE